MATKIISVALGTPGKGKTYKAVLLSKTGDRLSLQKASKMNMSALEKSVSGRDLCVSSQYADLISDEVELPPIADEKSLAFLVRHKLQESLKYGKNYTFVYQKSTSGADDKTKGAKPKKMYTVYAIPADMLEADYSFTPKLKKNITMVTFDQFGLAALSAKLDPKGLVCHAYADHESFVLSFSIGDNLEYARVSPVPQNITAADDLTDFYYENFNLTYLYVQQAKQTSISKIIFSGELVDNAHLRESVEKFTSIKIDTLLASNYLKNCSDKTFQEYLLPIAAAIAKDSYNFLALDFREEKVFRSTLIKVNAVLVLLLIMASGYAATRYLAFEEKKTEIEGRVKRLAAKVDSLERTIENKDVLIYQNAYIDILWRRERTPINLLAPSQMLLERNNYNVIDFTNVGENALMLLDSKKFDTFMESYLYEQKYVEFLKKFESIEGLFPDMKSRLDIPGRNFQIRTDVSGEPKIFRENPEESGDSDEEK